MFCFCGVREDQNEISAVQSSSKQIITSLQPNMRSKSIQGELQSRLSNCNMLHKKEFIRTSDSENCMKEYDDFISQCRGDYSGFRMQVDISEIQEEAKTSDEIPKLMHQGDGLLARIMILNQATTSYNDTFQTFILKILHETKKNYDVMISAMQITPQQEVKFVKHLVPHFITEQTVKRVKNDRLLITHDPTGSFLLKHLITNHVHYLQESKTYQPILNSALRIMNCEDKITYISKSDITDKFDTVIINLLNLDDTPLSLLLGEYLTLAHDVIIVVSPKIEYQELLSQLRYGIKNSQQSHIHCSIEIQNLYNKSQLIGRIIYYGEVSNISQNEQLSFLYNCIPKAIKKTLKYKPFLKDLRGKLGIMKLVDLFALYGLIQDNSEQAFDRFYQQVSNQYLSNVKSSRFLNEQVESSTSSTESESEDPVPLLKVNSSVLQEKIQSKSLTINYAKQEYVHFHSQNCKTKFTK